MSMTRLMTLAIVLAAVPALFAQDTKSEDKTSAEEQAAMEKIEQLKPAATQPAEGLFPRVTLTTTLGDIVLELNGEKAPISTKNFLDYVDAGFYDGLIFHRVMKNFMIQGGGFTPEMEHKQDGLRPPIKNEWQNGLKNVRGTIAMARTGVPDSATAQFFINVVDNASLDQPTRRGGNAAYAVLGKVVEGLDVVDQIRDTEVTTHPKLPMGEVVPKEAVVIKSVKVTRACDRRKLAAQAKAAKIAIEQTRAKAAAEVEERRKKAEAEKAIIAKEQAMKDAALLPEFIKKIEKETGKKVEQTASGLMYVMMEEGDGPAPTADDTVEVHYVGTFLDGKEFDSSVKRGQPATFPLRGVIKGWTEGVALMKVGGKCKLICPPDLAYGEGDRPGIPPSSTLVFDIELLSIKDR